MVKNQHRKSRLGCEQCKKRKVKVCLPECDEAKPCCGACSRHRIDCTYSHNHVRNDRGAEPPRSKSRATKPQLLLPRDPATTNDASSGSMASPAPDLVSVSTEASSSLSALEARLLHFFVAQTCETITTALDLWRVRVPLIAFDRRPVFDLIIALSALHVTREQQYGRKVAHRSVWRYPVGSQSFFDQQNTAELRSTSETYFQRGVEAHRVAMSQLSSHQDYESAFVSSILLSMYSLFMLGDVTTGPGLYSEGLWFQLAMGPRELVMSWRASAGYDVLIEWGVNDTHPNLTDDPELVNEENSRDFKILLDTGREFELLSREDADAYKDTLIYIGLMYKRAITKTESALALCRRLVAFPSRASLRFKELVLQQQHRALTMLVFVFAIAKLIEDEAILLKGIAQNQIPAIYSRLPPAWRRLLPWPLEILGAHYAPGQPIPQLFFE